MLVKNFWYLYDILDTIFFSFSLMLNLNFFITVDYFKYFPHSYSTHNKALNIFMFDKYKYNKFIFTYHLIFIWSTVKLCRFMQYFGVVSDYNTIIISYYPLSTIKKMSIIPNISDFLQF